MVLEFLTATFTITSITIPFVISFQKFISFCYFFLPILEKLRAKYKFGRIERKSFVFTANLVFLNELADMSYSQLLRKECLLGSRPQIDLLKMYARRVLFASCLRESLTTLLFLWCIVLCYVHFISLLFSFVL